MLELGLKHLSLTMVALFALAAIMISPGMQAFAANLKNEIVEPSNNLFSLESHYVIGFTTATTGTIKVITITFPAGFNILSSKLILASGISSGGISVAGQTLTYTVNSAVSVPSGTNIIIDLGKIVNNAVLSNTISVTTKDTLNNIIDGPTTSPGFSLRTVGTNMLAGLAVTNVKIANGAVTNTKIPNGSINGTQIVSGAALSGPVSIDSPTFSIDSINHRVGVGTTTPTSKLDILGDIKGSNNIAWNGGKSSLSADQGGSISLGDGLTPGLIPYIDFHYGKGVPQAFNMRLINNADRLLSLYGGVLSVNDSIYVGAKSNPTPGSNALYLKNDIGDGFNTFSLDAAGNNLYMIAKSDPGAATGAGIVFRTAPAGAGMFDRLSIDPAGNLNINSGGKLVCNGCIGTADLLNGTVTGAKMKAGIQVIDCTNLVPGANLSGCDLSFMDLHGKDLTGANLSGVNLFVTTLSGADLTSVNLSNAKLVSVNMTNANLGGANLAGADLSSSDLTGSIIDSANLSGTNLKESYFGVSSLVNANLNGANLKDATGQPTGSIFCYGTPIHASFTCIA